MAVIQGKSAKLLSGGAHDGMSADGSYCLTYVPAGKTGVVVDLNVVSGSGTFKLQTEDADGTLNDVTSGTITAGQKGLITGDSKFVWLDISSASTLDANITVTHI